MPSVWLYDSRKKGITRPSNCSPLRLDREDAIASANINDLNQTKCEKRVRSSGGVVCMAIIASTMRGELRSDGRVEAWSRSERRVSEVADD